MIKILRIAEGKNSTLSHLYVNDIFCCYLLEDKIRKQKIAGSTAIPDGTYQLKINKTAGMNTRYKSSYPQLHQGMIEIEGIKNFDLVFIHIGNYISNTAGCPLTGHYWTMVNGDYQVMQSAFAYQQVYPRLLDEIRKGDGVVEVRNGMVESSSSSSPSVMVSLSNHRAGRKQS